MRPARLSGIFLVMSLAALCGAPQWKHPVPGTTSDQVRRRIFDTVTRTTRISPHVRSELLSPSPLPRRSVIDAEIFGKLDGLGVSPATLSTDEEFLRRVTLDLTGRIPGPEDVRAFLADASPGKRDALIDKLLLSAEFTDRWTMWFGDLLQVGRANFLTGYDSRSAHHLWLKSAIAAGKSVRDIAYESIASVGNNYDVETGAVNFITGSIVGESPPEDTYDLLASNTASMFLGMAHFDCLLCHSGRGHLDEVSLWGSQATRTGAWRMAAYFSRVRHDRRSDSYHFDSETVSDAPGGSYELNSTYGNRPPRHAPMDYLSPQYWSNGDEPADGHWRESLAKNVVADRMFARNFANRFWKHFFGLGLVDPVDSLDPARLDPDRPPHEPWPLQATHPVLLEALAQYLIDNDFDMRSLMRLLAQSSAYQLSSRYDAPWKFEYVPLFARHYPRRLEAEELHDAIVKATEIPGRYPIRGGYAGKGWPNPVAWAVQLPGTAEPDNDAVARGFMSEFFRGNRGTVTRRQDGSISQQLALLNHPFVLNRLRVSASPGLQRAAALTDDDAALQELFLTFLGRAPDDEERANGLDYLSAASSPAERNGVIEDLAWVLINKLEFMFSY